MAPTAANEDELWHATLAGGFAGGVADTMFHPFDTVKTRLQAQVRPPYRYTSMGSAFSQILRHEGLRGIYAGFGATATASVPASALYFVAYEHTKYLLLPFFSADRASVAHFSAGVLGEIAASLVYVPFDVVKQRMQLQGQHKGHVDSHTRMGGSAQWNYRHTPHAIGTIVQREGVRGLYTGYGATLLRDAPFAALQFASFEYMNSWLISRHARSLALENKSGTVPSEQVVVIGGIAGALAAFLTTPLDVVKTRLQIQDPVAAGQHTRYNGVGDAFAKIWSVEGVAGFFKGWLPRVVWVAPQSAILLTAYQWMRTVLNPAYSSEGLESGDS